MVIGSTVQRRLRSILIVVYVLTAGQSLAADYSNAELDQDREQILIVNYLKDCLQACWRMVIF